MTEAKLTKGPVSYCENDEVGDFDIWPVDPETNGCGGYMGSVEEEADAKFIAEAFNVYTETSLTPRQLADRVKKLEGALEEARSAIANADIEKFGVGGEGETHWYLGHELLHRIDAALKVPRT